MRVLLIGATGLLGNSLWRLFSSKTGWEVTGTYFQLPLPGLIPLDICKPDAVEAAVVSIRPDVVVLSASDPNVDYCESSPERTRTINVEGTLSVAQAARREGCRLVFFSSDYVFDGNREFFSEEDPPSPLNEYGRQKLAVERVLLEFPEKALILRISALYGWELRPKNFVLQILSHLTKGHEIRVVCDQYYNPTYVEDLAQAMVDLLERRATNLYHLAGSQRISRAAFAHKIAEIFGLNSGLVVPIKSQEIENSHKARRPRFSSLRSDKVEHLLGRPLWGVDEGLRHMKASKRDWEAYAESLKVK